MRSLQCVRAGAALLVVYFHAVLQILLFGPGQGEQSLTPTSFPLFGKCGVDVFFVLSGLLMWQSTAAWPQSVAGFYRKRLLRIVPLYWTVTLLAAFGTLAAPGLLRSTRFDPAHLLASLFFVPWPNPAAGRGSDLMTPVVVPGWTLNFEIFFYLLFGLTLSVPRALRLFANIGLFAGVIVLVLVNRDQSLLIAFYDPSLLLEFVLGLGLGAVLAENRSLPIPAALLLLPVAAFALCWLDATPTVAGRLVDATLPAVAVMAAVSSLELRARWPDLPFVTRLGDASFSLYLTHVFVLAALRTGFGRAGLSLARPGAQVLYVAGGLVASCMVAFLVFRFVERPIGLLLGRLASSRRKPQSAAWLRSTSADGGVPVLSASSDDVSRSSGVSGF